MANITRDVSYLRARDPSIRMYFHREQLKMSRKNIKLLMDSSVSSDDSVIIESEPEQAEELQQEYNCIQVYLRVKPSEDHSPDYIIQDNTLKCRVPEQSLTSRSGKDKDFTFKKFSFTKIFGPESKQTDIFESVVKGRVLNFINGENRSLFTYGVSGAGKTFTIVGSAEEPGLIPRALEYLFRTLPELPDTASVKPLNDGQVIRLTKHQIEAEREVRSNILKSHKKSEKAQNIKTYREMQVRLSNDAAALLEPLDEVSIGIWVTFAEIYNEEIFDLLQPEPPRGKQKPRLRIGTNGSHVYIKDLTHVNVSSGLEAFLVFQHGLQKLTYAKTNLNNHSSRSHSIFSIKIAQSLNNAIGVHVSTFNFCDLAGVGRSKKTMNVGDRLKESNSINTSLMVLGRCIAALRNSQKSTGSNQSIPFRDSKLTQLFQRALSGFEDLCMMVNVNTSKYMIEESLTVLNFSTMTKETVLQPQYEQKNSNSNQSSKREYLKKLDDEIGKQTLIPADLKEKYLGIKNNREQNYRLERQNLEEGWKEVYEGHKEMNENKIHSLRDKYERKFQHDSEKVKRHYKEKSERSKKRKLVKKKLEEENVTLLEKKSMEQQASLTKLQKEIHDLKAAKKEVIETFCKTEEKLLERLNIINNEIFSKFKDKSDRHEMDSFLKNEFDCANSPMMKSNELRSDNFISDLQNNKINELSPSLTNEGEIKTNSENLDITNFSIKELDETETNLTGCETIKTTNELHSE